MATEAGFAGNHFQESDNIKRRASNVNKRKRESTDVGLSGNRAAPTTRRTSAQYTAPAPPQQQSDPSPETDDSGISELGNETFQSSAANGSGGGGEDPHTQFDFALQPSTTGNQIAQATTTGETGSGVNIDTATAALTQHYTMTVPRHPAESFANEPTIEPDNNNNNISLEPRVQLFESLTSDGLSLTPFDGSSSATRNVLRRAPVGSEEWHKVRKDNHKEVERRRRETINEGINELSKIVPGCEKNKGSILQRAVQYIAKLHDEASQNIDKWTFEKLVTEQAINELSAKLSRAWAEKEAWKRVAREAGVDVDSVDLGVTAGAEAAAAAAAGGSAGAAAAAASTTTTTAASTSSVATAATSGEQAGGSADEDGGATVKQGQAGNEAA